MSYKASLDGIDDEDFAKVAENITIEATRSEKKRKAADEDEESEDETSKKVCKSNMHMWSKEKTDKLLELVQINQDRLLDRRTKKTRIWKDILEELHTLDKNLTVHQVEKKWKNMVQSYKKFKENIKTRAIPNMRKPDFFEIVGEIMRTDSYTNIDFDYSEPMIITSVRSLEEDADIDTSSCLETRLTSEQNLPEDDPSESPNDKREVKRCRKNRSSTNFELVEKSVQQLVETNAKAVRVDQMKLKFLETQTNRQDKFDKDVLDAIKERNFVTKRTSNVLCEFREMLKEHMKLVKDIDARTKKMEKFIDTHFKINAK